jgi:hypothetical protein
MYKFFPIGWSKKAIYDSESDENFPTKTQYSKFHSHFALDYIRHTPEDHYVYWYLFNYDGSHTTFKEFIHHLETELRNIPHVYYAITLPIIARTCLLTSEYKNLNYIINRYKERPGKILSFQFSRSRSYYLLIATNRKSNPLSIPFLTSCLCQYAKCHIWIAKITQSTTHQESFFGMYNTFMKEELERSSLVDQFQYIATVIFKRKYGIDIKFDP